MNRLTNIGVRCYSVSTMRAMPMGCGAGKGGGSGGAVREAGGILGIMEAAREEIYFRGLRELQLKALTAHKKADVQALQDVIRGHEEEIVKAKDRMATILEDAAKK